MEPFTKKKPLKRYNRTFSHPCVRNRHLYHIRISLMINDKFRFIDFEVEKVEKDVNYLESFVVNEKLPEKICN